MGVTKWFGQQTVATGNVDQHDVAVLEDGSYVIVWAKHNGVDEVKFQLYNADGSLKGIEQTVPTFGGDDQHTPSVAALSNGGFVIAAVREDAVGGDQDLSTYVFDSNGALTNSVEVVEADSTTIGTPDVASVGDNYVIAWRDDDNGGDIRAELLDISGSGISAEQTVNTIGGGVGDQSKPVATQYNDGIKGIAWYDYEANRRSLRNYDSNMVAIESPERRLGDPIDVDFDFVSSSYQSYGFAYTRDERSDGITDIVAEDQAVWGRIASPLKGNQSDPQIAFLSNSSAFGVYEEEFGESIRGGLFGPFGDQLESEFVVAQGNAQDPEAATLPDDRVIVVFNQDGDIVHQIMDPRDGVVNGTSGDDILYGNRFDEELNGYSGNDTIFGMIGDDVILGNGGDDLLNGGVGNDIIEGGGGEDIINGGSGNDQVSGGAGQDTINGHSGDDVLDGDAGNDLIRGGSGNDIVFGGDDDDVIRGQAGDDTLFGENGNDNIKGHDGNDILNGGDGTDTLSGGNDDDVLNGGLDADILKGNAGSDRFEFDSALGGGNIDEIRDFEVGIDLIGLGLVVFTSPDLADGLDANEFEIGAAATTADTRIIYDDTTGALSYDADGNGAGASEQFATLGTGLGLSEADFGVF